MGMVNGRDEGLANFLARRQPSITEPLTWGGGLRLEVAAYLGTDTPPLPLVSSVRAIVRRADTVLVLQDRDSRHILPGGRREADEEPEATLRREVREETGWALERLRVIGFLHYHHLSPRPQDYRYPYPDFCQTVYAAWAVDHDESAVIFDEYVLGSALHPVAEVWEMALAQRDRLFLDAALALDLP